MVKEKVVRDIMDKKVVYAREDASLQETSRLLVSNKISGMPVINSKGSVVGFVSERDIIEAVSSGDCNRKKTKDVMTKKVTSIDEGTSIEEASQLFSRHPFRYLPVCKNKKIVGIISRKAVIDRLLGQYY